MSVWINGRSGTRIDCRDRGLQYGDGLFETMRIRRGSVRLLDYHLERLAVGCARLKISGPSSPLLRREIVKLTELRRDGVLKLIITRGSGPRGYRPSGGERCTRIVTLHGLARAASRGLAAPARVRECATPLGINPRLAGLKTLNRLESVLARSEWTSPRIWEGVMADGDGQPVCGTMSNLFIRRGSFLMTPALDRCGVAGVMRRWVLESAQRAGLKALEGRFSWNDLIEADEVFMTNAVAGVVSVGWIHRAGRATVKLREMSAAEEFRAALRDV